MKKYNSISKLVILFLAVLGTMNAARSYAQGRQITRGGTAYSIAAPYSAEDLFEIQFVQSADMMFMTHNEYPPQILRRYNDTTWTIGDLTLERGPFMKQNEVETWKLNPSDTTGDIKITANRDTFDGGHVGALFQLTHHVQATVRTGEIDDDESSDTLPVALNQDYIITTKSNWYGDLTIEKSYDDGESWRDVHNWSAQGNYDNLTYMGTETVDEALYRITVDNYEVIPKEKYQGSGEDLEVIYVEEDMKYNLTAREYEREGIVRITSFGDERYVKATVLYDLGDEAATWRWREGSFSEYRGYPASVCLFHERLVLAGTVAEPHTIWFSQTNDWENFLVNDLATSAMTLNISADQLNSIIWMAPHSDLIIGTTGDEWKLYTPNDKSLSPENLPAIKRQSTYGSAPIKPVIINNKVTYVQRNAKKILRTGYAIESDNWHSDDMTILAEQITGEGVTQIAYQRSPYQVLWASSLSGDLLCCVLEDNQEVLGWSRYVFDGDCESVAVKPGATEDEVWVIIKRTIDGTESRYVEQFMPFDWGPDDADAFYVDSGLSFDGGAEVDITIITQADPAVVTAPGHAFTDGMNIRFSEIGGMTEVNNKVYTVSTVSASSFEIKDASDSVDINSVDFTAYTSGGTVIRVENTFTGLDHLEGETVAAAADAGYAGSYTVSTGDVTLSDYYNKVHIGLPYTSRLMPMSLEFLSTGGALQGRRKRITATTLRLYDSLGGSIGPTWTKYDNVVYRQFDDLLEEATPFFTGDNRVLFRGGWLTDGDICVQQSMPLPFTLLSLICEYEANE